MVSRRICLPATSEQVTSLPFLIRMLKSRYDLSSADIFSHAESSYRSGNEGDDLVPLVTVP
jgi:hypothetical protein